MEEKKESLWKEVAKTGMIGVLFSTVAGVSPLVVCTTSMSMTATTKSLERIRGKKDFWNSAAAGGVGLLSVGILSGAKPQVIVPCVVAGSIFTGLAHVLFLED